jgi:hypothetical protein
MPIPDENGDMSIDLATGVYGCWHEARFMLLSIYSSPIEGGAFLKQPIEIAMSPREGITEKAFWKQPGAICCGYIRKCEDLRWNQRLFTTDR